LKPVIFLESARSDLRDEVERYSAIDPGLALRFISAVESASRRIGRNPEAMQIVEAQVRRWPVDGFPHGVLYRVLPDCIAVLAVFHPRRNPAAWKGRV
jgi:plasmid stabilization system protein ParE